MYFLFRNKNKKEYFQLIFNLMMGMTVFLVFSYIYPNVLYLRPAVFPRSNIFTRLLAELYRTDTPTNILPSIHVFNSLAVYFAIHHCQALKDRKCLQRGALILSVLIILSTMFSYLDIITTVSSIMLVRAATQECLDKKQELQDYIKDQNMGLYRKLRRSLFGRVSNLPGRGGRKMFVAAYKICQKFYGFN